MNIVTITLQKRIMMDAQFTLMFVGNGSRAPSLHKQQVCLGYLA